MYDIPSKDYIKARWMDLYPQDDTGDDSNLQLSCSNCHICMIDWCDKENIFWLTDINLSLAEDKWLEDKVVKKSIKRFTQTGLVPSYMASRKRKKREVVHDLMRVLVHLHCPMPTNAPTSVNIYILNFGMGNMLI